MFGIRTPKKPRDQDPQSRSPPTISPAPISNVRKSVGEWESGRIDDSTRSPTMMVNTAPAGPSMPKRVPVLPQDSKAAARRIPVEGQSSPKQCNYADRTAEARACLNKAKLHLNNSRNLKTDIKAGVVQAIDRLYQLVKEAEAGSKQRGKEPREEREKVDSSRPEEKVPTKDAQNNFLTRLEEHSKLLLESNQRMDELKTAMGKQFDNLERKESYSSVAASKPGQKPIDRVALHSIIVTSEDETEKGEEVLDKVREAVDAKEGWIRVEKVRKAKDRKIIMSCRTEEERNKIKERIEGSGKRLICQDVHNKDPLLILKDVLLINNDSDVLKAIRNQNQNIFRAIDPKDDRVEIKYRRRARNPLTGHIVLSTSPTIWKRATEAGTLHIDLQRIRVEDQSPLVQCTRCLGYGHGKRFCKETIDLCSHCGGPHLRAECAEWLAGAAPSCKNCMLAKYDQHEHNAFSQACPVRKRWDILARSSVAYC